MAGTTIAPAVDQGRVRTGVELARYIATVGIAGLITGVAVGGIGSRIFMRIAAATAADAAQGALTEADARVGAITFEGTMAIVVFVGIAAGIAGAVFYAVFRPWLSWAGRLKGLSFGVVLLAVGSATSDVLNPDNFDFTLLKNQAIAVPLIILLFLGFGLVMEAMFGVLDRRLPPADGDHRKARVVYGAITGLGAALALLLIPGLLFSHNSCDCDPPIMASLFVVMAAAGTLVSWASDIGERSDRSFSTARILGLTGLAGTVVFGLWRAGSDAITILTASS